MEPLEFGRNPDWPNRLLRGGTVYEMRGAGLSIREIARESGTRCASISAEEKPQEQATFEAGPVDHIDTRLSEGLDNCVVLLRELLSGTGYTILKDYVQPRRRRRQPNATIRFSRRAGAG